LKTGDWLTIICAVFWALQVILIARFAGNTGRPVTLAVTQFAVCAALSLAAAWFVETTDLQAISRAAPEILYAGVFSGGIAFTFQAIGQRYSSPAQAAILLSSESVFAAGFAAIFLGERFQARGYAGCALILAAILAVEVVPSLARFSGKVRAP
jgi:drug/metabolite transporter (DMT)-like permease